MIFPKYTRQKQKKIFHEKNGEKYKSQEKNRFYCAFNKCCFVAVSYSYRSSILLLVEKAAANDKSFSIC